MPSSFKPVLHAGNDRLRKPLRAVARAKRLAQRHHQAGVRILAHKFRNHVARISAGLGVRRRQMIRKMMRAGKSVRKMNVVKALQHPDAAPVGLRGQPLEEGDVLVQLRRGQLLRLRIFRQLQQAGEGMAVPKVERVVALLGQHVEILGPRGLVVEERKILRRVGIVVLGVVVGDLLLLHPDAGSAQLQRRMFHVVDPRGQRLRRADAIGQLQFAVEHARRIGAGNDPGFPNLLDEKSFLGLRPELRQIEVCELRRAAHRDQHARTRRRRLQFRKRGAQFLRAIEFARRRALCSNHCDGARRSAPDKHQQRYAKQTRNPV